MTSNNSTDDSFDEASQKGAVETGTLPTDTNDRAEHSTLAGQLGHRDQNEMLKDNDTDFPEPDAEGEHTGERQ